MSNGIYFIRITDINITVVREKKKFDELILSFIKSYEGEKITITHLATAIAIAIDYPIYAVVDLIHEYALNGLITKDFKVVEDNVSKYIHHKQSIKLKSSLALLFDINTGRIVELRPEDKDYKEITNNKNKYENDSKKLSVDNLLEIYNYILKFNSVDYSPLQDENKRLDLAYTIRKLKNKFSKSNESSLRKYFENFEIIGPIYNKEIDEKYFKSIISPDTRRKINYYKDILDEKKIFKKITLGEVGSKCFKEEQQNLIVDCLNRVKKSVFVVSIENPMKSQNIVSKAFQNLDKSIYKRFMGGLTDSVQTIEFDESNNYYCHRFKSKIHSKIIIIDDELVIMGSGNWFRNNDTIDDSLIIFYSKNANKKYNPMFSKNSDLYKLIPKEINALSNLKDAFNLLKLINMDTLAVPGNENFDSELDVTVADKIIALLKKCYKEEEKYIIDFINDDVKYCEWIQAMVKEHLKLLMTDQEYEKFERKLKEASN